MIGLALKEYADRHDDKNLSKITITSTFSTKGFPKSVDKVTLGNTWVPQYIEMPVSHDVSKLIKGNTANMRALIGSNTIMGMDLFIGTLLQLPYNLSKFAFNILSNKITMTFSSLRCPNVGYDWGEYHLDAAYGFIPSVGDMMFAITCFSAENTLKLGMISDKVCVKHPDEFIQILNQKFREFMYGAKTGEISQKLSKEKALMEKPRL